MNMDPEIRKLINVFRSERREIFSDTYVDLNTLRNCCQILIDEIDDLIKMKLQKNWPKYQKALMFFNECLRDADREKLSQDANITIPKWLTEEKA